jgi:large subunit ribosomal protein L20
MPRNTGSSITRNRHKKVLKAARGMYGAPSRRYRLAKQKLFKAGVYATRDRRDRKREFRRLWIVRISAACEMRGIRYSQFINALFKANVDLNRKMLSEIAIADPAAFDAIVAKVMPQAVAATA